MRSFGSRLAVASLFAVGVLALPACASKPTITLNHAELSSAGLNGIGFTIFLNVKNDNSFDVMVRNVRANVTLQDRYQLPPLQYDPNQWLGANQTTVVPAPLVIPWLLVPQLIHDTVSQPMINYRVTGAADVTATRSLQVERNDYPVDERGSVPRQQIVDMATRAMIPF